jgi:hypothetical protein
MWFSLIAVVVDVYEIIPLMLEMECLDIPTLVITIYALAHSKKWVVGFAYCFQLCFQRQKGLAYWVFCKRKEREQEID